MLAIIPARGGSKGLPGKNIRELGGKPLIAHTIQAALQAQGISKVIFSTDCPEMAEVARSCGAEVPFLRPPELAGDASLIIDTYIYTLDRLAAEGTPYESMMALLPTAPLRNSGDIENAIKIFKDKNADSVISVYEAPHPLRWHLKFNEKGALEHLFPNGNKLANRQEDAAAYLPNGAIYIFKSVVLKEQKVYYTDKTYPYLMPRARSVDIDTLEDFEYAEFLLSKKKQNSVR